MHSRPNRQWKIGTVENCRHHWYLLIWIVYFVLFYIAEHVVTDHYWVSYLPLDDKIPFCRYFIIPYCMWHPLLFAMTLYLMWYDVPAFKRFMVYIGLGFGGSILFCLIFPNGQDLRPTEFAQHDFFIWLVQRIYTADTNTNVLPSMHVIGCAALTLACFDSEPLCRRHLQWVALPLGLLICASRCSSSSTRSSTCLSPSRSARYCISSYTTERSAKSGNTHEFSEKSAENRAFFLTFPCKYEIPTKFH